MVLIAAEFPYLVKWDNWQAYQTQTGVGLHLFADFDNDGWKDLFISNGILKDITNLDFVKYTSGYTARSYQYKRQQGRDVGIDPEDAFH